MADDVRILHLIHSSAFGGGPAMVELLCSRLHGHGFEMSLVSSGEGELPARLSALGIDVIALPLETKGSFVRHLPHLARVIRQKMPDLLHLHGHFAASLGQFAVLAAGRPKTIYSAQWPAYLDDVNAYSRLRNWIAEWMSCRLANRVVAVSEHDRQTLISRRLCARSKLTVIYNAYDPARFAAAANGGSAAANGMMLGFVGRLVDQKGCDVLIEAMPKVLAQHPEIRLRVVGDGPDRPRLEALTHRLDLARAVDFVGYRPTSAALLADVDIVVVPSRYEPFGIVAVEAMASGRPVVASAVGGLSEIVADGQTGLLVPPGDPDRLAAALTRLLDHPEVRETMASASRRRVAEKFSPEVSIQAYAKEYRRLGG